MTIGAPSLKKSAWKGFFRDASLARLGGRGKAA
jgi:hypothetical protein